MRFIVVIISIISLVAALGAFILIASDAKADIKRSPVAILGDRYAAVQLEAVPYAAEQTGLLDVDYLQLSSAGPDLRAQLFADMADNGTLDSH